ncbi:MAG: bifunctional DNA-formamidopyrimidine glycosylase/DNA-(apurinic or apyrimidinic site) lyase [Vicinamibacterales bacterium]
MPELPEVDSVRRLLAPVMAGQREEALLVRRANLRIPFPADFEARLVGHTVIDVTRRAKYLLAALSSGETLIVHLGMSGWFRVERAIGPEFDAEPGNHDDDPKHDHVVFRMASGMLVTFNDPRRFGLMDLALKDALHTHPALKHLGPEPLSSDFDGEVLARACHRRRTPIKVALLDQTVVAGVGNIYASEACFEARLSPKRKAATIATAGGAPKPKAHALAAAVVKVLERAIAKPGARFKVYERAGAPCPRRACGGTIKRIVQAGRSTFYCPVCQR